MVRSTIWRLNSPRQPLLVKGDTLGFADDAVLAGQRVLDYNGEVYIYA